MSGPMDWRIYSTGSKLWWSQQDGWADLQSATVLSNEEKALVRHLPADVGASRWVDVDEIYPLGDTGDERRAWDLFFDLDEPREGYLDQVPEGVEPDRAWTVYEDGSNPDGVLIARPGISWHHPVVLGFVLSDEPWENAEEEFVYFNGKLDA